MEFEKIKEIIVDVLNVSEEDITMNTTFKDELNAGFHVSIVRLYQAKDDTNEAANPITEYPTSDSKIPVGITEEEFKKLFA